MNLVTTDWLKTNLNKVKIFDATWHMPNLKRDARKEYLENIFLVQYFGTLISTVIRALRILICSLTLIIGLKCYGLLELRMMTML